MTVCLGETRGTPDKGGGAALSVAILAEEERGAVGCESNRGHWGCDVEPRYFTVRDEIPEAHRPVTAGHGVITAGGNKSFSIRRNLDREDSGAATGQGGQLSPPCYI
jgi:hypothetical protein